VFLALLAAGAAGCAEPAGTDSPLQEPKKLNGHDQEEEAFYGSLRELMVKSQIEARGIQDPVVLRALRAVPRHRFVDPAQRDQAYDDHPLSIGGGQTISQPYIVALMSEAAGISARGAEAKVLEVGTGSGYQAAVLAAMGVRVWSVEIIEPLAKRATKVLAELGYDVQVRTGDGYRGWPEEAPFDAILVTAAPDHVPEPLYEQLAPGGRLVIPVGGQRQELMVVQKTPQGRKTYQVAGVRFVPMRGEAEKRGR
jgi:protein-L-isoaspartate(D-aspartate) O-methyltransferase